MKHFSTRINTACFSLRTVTLSSVMRSTSRTPIFFRKRKKKRTVSVTSHTSWWGGKLLFMRSTGFHSPHLFFFHEVHPACTLGGFSPEDWEWLATCCILSYWQTIDYSTKTFDKIGALVRKWDLFIHVALKKLCNGSLLICLKKYNLCVF